MSTDYAVELANIHKIYHTHHFFSKNEAGRRRLYHKKTIHAVNDVSIGIKQGEILGLLGPNGAGKTTCVKMISGLVRPTGGKVRVGGIDVERNRSKVLRQLGVVLEGTRTVIWPLTPLENLKYFGRLRGVSGKVLKTRAMELLEFIGLKDKVDTQVRRLSRGQRQRLAICISLITDPNVILLDEPTTGLDVSSSRAIRQKVRQMTREMGKTILITTHDMNVAQEMCDRIGIIDKGKLITLRPTGELLDLFADHTYELRLDRMPEASRILEIPGVHEAEVCTNGSEGEETFVLQVCQDDQQRSEALYQTMTLLRQQGIVLRSISQRQQTLENIFVRLTESSM
jgi:ABC-2 type transport system ATP-binding protein